MACVIVRHAQSAANAGDPTANPADIPVTPLGRIQAEYCATNLLRDAPDLIVVSPYLRTVQTAEPLARRFPGVPVEEWPIQEFTYLDPVSCAGTNYEERQSQAGQYWEQPDPQLRNESRCESFSGFMERVKEAAAEIARRSAGRPLAIFTHGCVMKAMLWLEQYPEQNIEAEAMAHFHRFASNADLPNCSALFLRTTRLTTSPSLDHLPEYVRS